MSCDIGNPSANQGSSQGLNLADCFALNDKQTVASVYSHPSDLINLLVKNVFIVAGIILFVMIIYSGYLFISGGTKGADQAKTVISTAIAGFLIMFSAYWIIQIIKLLTGANIVGF